MSSQTSLGGSVSCEADNDFLRGGGVFTEYLIDTWVSYERANESRPDGDELCRRWHWTVRLAERAPEVKGREMADARGPWNEVGDKLGALALKLKLHAQEEMSEDRKAEARSAVERFGATIQGAIDGISDAAKDPAVKDDAKAAGQALSTAVNATVEEVLKAFKTGSPGGTTPPADSGGTASPDAPKSD